MKSREEFLTERYMYHLNDSRGWNTPEQASKIALREWDKYVEIMKVSEPKEETVTVTVYLELELIGKLALEAHRRDMTLNQFIVMILVEESRRTLDEQVDIQDQDCGSVGC